MHPTIATAVQDALELLKAGKKAEAHALLIPVVKQNPNAAEAWYLLGFAVTDLDKSLYCFRQVLRIDPSNQAAQKQLARLTVSQPVTPEAVVSHAQPFVITPPPAIAISKPAPPPTKKKPLKKNPIFWVGIALAAVVIIVVTGASALYLSNGTDINKRVDALFLQRNCVEVVQYTSFGETFPRGIFSSFFDVYHQVEECQAQLALEQAIESENWPAAYSTIQNYLISHPNGAFAADMLAQAGDVLLSWSKSLIAQHDYKTAIEKLELIKRGFPASSAVPISVTTIFDDYLLWAKYLYEQQDYQTAEQTLKLVISDAQASPAQVQQANQGLATVYLQWGKEQVEKGEFDEGVQHYEDARNLDPDLADYEHLKDQVTLLRIAARVVDADFDGALAMARMMSETALSEKGKTDALAEQAKILDAYAHSDSPQAQAQIITAATNMCTNQQLPTIPIFGLEAETVRFAFVSIYNIQIPNGWAAMRPAELRYIVCIESTSSVLQSCGYSGAYTVRRNRYIWVIKLYEINTGKLHKTTSIEGSIPRLCAQTERFYSGSRISEIHGTMPNIQQVLDWLAVLNIVK